MGYVEIVELRTRERSELLIVEYEKLRCTEDQGALELRDLRCSKSANLSRRQGRELRRIDDGDAARVDRANLSGTQRLDLGDRQTLDYGGRQCRDLRG